MQLLKNTFGPSQNITQLHKDKNGACSVYCCAPVSTFLPTVSYRSKNLTLEKVVQNVWDASADI